MKLRVLTGEPGEMADVQRVIEEAATYAQLVTGHPPGPAEAQSNFTVLPPGKGYEDKFYLGIYAHDKMIGCIDIIRSYPNRKTAMLGLLLISEKHQGKGYGRAAYEKLETFVRRWAGIEKIRIGVVATNEGVLGFWRKMGFRETGERKPWRYDKLVSENIVCEKPVTSEKSRYSMRARLSAFGQAAHAQTSAEPVAIPITQDDADAVAACMYGAYRGTIDDEGETLEHYIAETRATLAGKYGPFAPSASFHVDENGKPVSVTLVTIWQGKPLLAYSVTDPAHQGKGLATFLIRKTLRALAENGYTEIELGATCGNATAESLYRTLGFEPIP